MLIYVCKSCGQSHKRTDPCPKTIYGVSTGRIRSKNAGLRAEGKNKGKIKVTGLRGHELKNQGPVVPKMQDQFRLPDGSFDKAAWQRHYMREYRKAKKEKTT